ncbi:MAG: GbsR/MarR family transcriptional regulator [Planctomycetota bacterium]|jgi:DNA-binding transcriptional regulator GbsR (MarR family)
MARTSDDKSPETPTADALREGRDRFVALWGQMGSTWGIPRTMAQVHALLFIAGEPLNTDDVMDGLGISRGNASMTLRGLVDWGIVSRVHRRGDRKEYFLAEQDVWKMFRTILAERKKRELDPLREELAACRSRTERVAGRKLDSEVTKLRAHNERLDQLIEFMRIVDNISQRFSGPSGKGLELAAKLLDRAS